MGLERIIILIFWLILDGRGLVKQQRNNISYKYSLLSQLM